MAEIKVFKLVSGEEIIGSLVSQSSSPPGYVLEKVRAIHLVPQGQHQFGVAMMPFMTSDPSGQITIMTPAISAQVVNVPDDMERTYLAQTSSIQIASTLMEGVK